MKLCKNKVIPSHVKPAGICLSPSSPLNTPTSPHLPHPTCITPPPSPNPPHLTSLTKVRMVRGIHRLPKVSPEPAMPNPFTPCRRVTPKTALWLFLGWSTHRERGLRPSSTSLDIHVIWACLHPSCFNPTPSPHLLHPHFLHLG
jgi:hypothetical protein